jgi:putative ABC transport system permease protein
MVPMEIEPQIILNASVKHYDESVIVTKETIDFYVLGTTIEPPLGIRYCESNSYIQLVIAESSIPLLPTIAGDENAVDYTKVSCNTSKVEGICEWITDIINPIIPRNEAFIFSGAENALHSQQTVSVFNVFAYGFIALISLISIANMCNTISTSFAVRRSEFAMLKSVGMTPRAFKKMIVFESLLYGIKALVFGLPVGVLFNYLIFKAVRSNFTTDYSIPYSTYFIAIISVFLVVSVAMLYSTSKIRKDNIIDGLKSEII